MNTPVASPCISVCQMDEASGWCTGCLRTLDEIAAWSTLAEAQKREVWQAIGRRRLAVRRLQPAAVDSLKPGQS